MSETKAACVDSFWKTQKDVQMTAEGEGQPRVKAFLRAFSNY